MQFQHTLRATITLIVGITSLTACSFVDTMPGSETVVISHDTANCKRLGETHVKVLSSIAGINRNTDTMAEELTILARNAAFDRAADTIQPITEIEDGKQSFALFKCQQ